MDFVSFLPLFVSSSADTYSFLRLLRVLRLQRLLTDVETFAEVREALGLSSTFDRSRVEVTLQLARVFSSLFTLLFVVRAPASLYSCQRPMTRTMLAPVRADGLPRPPHVRRHTLIGITVRGHASLHDICPLPLFRDNTMFRTGVGPHLRRRVGLERADLGLF